MMHDRHIGKENAHYAPLGPDELKMEENWAEVSKRGITKSTRGLRGPK